MEYAPVIIKTLNRYDHLRQCIESLQKNKGAESTDIYISVDYPPSEKYREGYLKVRKYTEQGITGFHKVHIFYHEKNIGAHENTKFLIKEAEKDFDTYIFTEDDNVFSPCFLTYVNECLEKYADDENIFAICGYSYPVEWERDGVIIKNTCLFPAWGYATWINRRKQLLQFSKEDIQQYMKHFHNAHFLYKKNRHLFIEAVHIARNNHYLALNDQKKLKHIDCVMGLYLTMRDKYSLMPTVSMVRNIGCDGSGLNCARITDSRKVNVKEYDFSQQPIDEREEVHLNDYKIVPISQSEIKKLDQYMVTSLQDRLKAWIIWTLLYIRLLKA